MTQDFAKIKPEPLLERKTVAVPPAWSLLFTGIIVGLAVGVFGCFLFYLSGNVPPLNRNTPAPGSVVTVNQDAVNQDDRSQDTTDAIEEELQLEFYTELPSYEVPVDATPVELTAQQAGVAAAIDTPNRVENEPEQTYYPGFMLQTGAFQQFELANSESQRQQILGLNVKIKQQQLLGRTLYLVQSGPYTSSSVLNQAEQLLRANNIPSLRMSIQ